jgi:hypothetical protein
VPEMKRLIKTVTGVSLLIGTATANTSGYYPGGMDYYWVPSNILLFHVNYPLDFLIYFFAILGFLMAVFIGYLWVKDWWKKHMVG